MSVRAVVAELTSPACDGREFATAGEARAADFIAGSFDRLHLPPPPGHGRFQPVRGVVGGVELASQRGSVLAWLDAGARDTVVLSAHHDHLGHGGPLSKAPMSNALHPGADDNASGVALMLAVAERLAHYPRLPVNVLFFSASGEEQGLLGAQAFVASPVVPLARLRCVVNLDMVGRLDVDAPILSVEGTFERPALAALVKRVPARGFTVRSDEPIFEGGSDHFTFHRAGVPVLGLSSGVTGDYHRPSDAPGTLNYAGLEALTDYVVALVEALAEEP